MASSRTILTALQLMALVCCIATAELKSIDNADKVEDIDTDNDEADLQTQETGWLLQEKMRQLEYLKNKLFSPFLGLKSNYNSYGGGYPSYSTNGGNKFSSNFYYGGNYPSNLHSGGGSNYPTSFSGGVGGSISASYPTQYQFSSYRPFNTYKTVPYVTSNVWLNKGYSSGFQPSTSSYAPDCDYTTGNNPLPSSYVPSTPTYSSGSPLYYQYAGVGPSQTYGIPLSTKSSFGSTRITFPSPVPPQSSTVPEVPSGGVILKSSPQYSLDSSQFSGPSSFSSVVPSLPSTPAPPSWSYITASFPSSPSPPQVSSISSLPSWSSLPVPSAPSTPAPPSWSAVTASFPSSPSPPQVPSISSLPSWSSLPVPSGPSSPSLPSWSTVAPSFPSSSPSPSQVSSTPSPPSFYSITGSIPTTPSPIISAQPNIVVPPSPVPSDYQNETPSQEIVITPAPQKVNGHYITTLPGPKIALPEESSPYNPASTYAVSYYPNVFFISNEQHLDSPSLSATPAQSRPAQTLSSSSSPVVSSGASSSSSETTTPSPNAQSISQAPSRPALTTFYSSNTIDQTRIPIVYTVQQPASPPTNGIFYNYPVVPNAYSASSGYASPHIVPQGVQTISSTKPLIPVNAYPVSFGYAYGTPNQITPEGIQSVSTTKTPLPGC